MTQSPDTSSEQVHKAYKLRIYPNKEQEQKLLQTIGACRWVYNYYLTLQINTYLQTGENVPYAELSRDLKELRNNGTYPWLKEVQSTPIQQSVRMLDTAYGNFYRKRSLLPTFKSRSRSTQSFRKPKDWRLAGDKVFIQKDIVVKSRGRLPNEGAELKSLTVSVTNTGKWYASIQVIEKLEKPGTHTAPVGIDLGINHLAITSDGQKFENLRLARKQAKRLKYLQQSLARKQRGSNRRRKTKLEISRLHEKVANRRMNHLHQVSSAITSKNHALIAVEGLAVSNMLRNRRLSRSISDVSWSEFVRQIEYKQKWRAGQFVKVGRFFPSSKTCSRCQFKNKDMPLSIREWTCSQCNAHHDRDINAAVNILKQAEAQLGVESTESKASDGPRVTGSVKRGYEMRSAE